MEKVVLQSTGTQVLEVFSPSGRYIGKIYPDTSGENVLSVMLVFRTNSDKKTISFDTSRLADSGYMLYAIDQLLTALNYRRAN